MKTQTVTKSAEEIQKELQELKTKASQECQQEIVEVLNKHKCTLKARLIMQDNGYALEPYIEAL